MAQRPGFVDEVEDLLQAVGPVHVRAMFGGFGVFLDDVMFGLIAGETLFLKVDDTNRESFEEVGREPFAYESNRGLIAMSYHQAPNPSEGWRSLEPWVIGALAAARRAKAAKAPRARSRRQ